MRRSVSGLAMAALLAGPLGCVRGPEGPPTARQTAENTEVVAPPAVDASPPRLVIETRGGCAFVAAEGTPAITSDGSVVAVPYARHRAHGISAGSLALHWIEVDSGERVRTDVLVEDHDSVEDDETRDCAEVPEEVAGRVRATNQALAERDWRRMERLMPAALGEPPQFEVFADDDQGSTSLHSLWGDRRSGTVVFVLAASAFDDLSCTPCFPVRVQRGSSEELERAWATTCPAVGVEPDPCMTRGLRESEGFSPFSIAMPRGSPPSPASTRPSPPAACGG
ncbi:hypothetical protein [Plesiocystis pacifica]|nr:hypothetical protein [Plesiocystis pacifica]